MNKAEVGRKLAQVNKEILDTSSKLNKSVSIPILLCLEDAVENCQLDVLKQNQVDKGFNSVRGMNFLINMFLAEFYKTIGDSILSIVANGFLSSTKITNLPVFLFGIYVNQNIRDYLQELIEEGKIEGIDEKNDVVYHTELSFHQYQGGFVIILRKGSRKHKDNLKKILALRKLFYQKSLLEQMLGLPDGTKVEFDESGMLRSILPQEMAELLSEQIDSGSKFLETNTFVPDWNSDFTDTWLETLNSPLLKGKDNIAHLKKEEKEIFKSYEIMKNYSKTFEQLFGIGYARFFNVVSEMIHLCYNNPHTIGVWDSFELSKKIKAKTKFHPKDIGRIIKLLSERPELKKSYCTTIILGNKILANFHRLNKARLVLSEHCFEEAYSNDLKGNAFEKACRKLMYDKGLVTLPRPVDIFEPMLSPAVSYRLWNKQKNRSDVDVISCSDNRIIVIECKEIKSRKLETRKIRLLERYSIEHFFKTKWIAENIDRFEKYVGRNLNDALSVDKKRAMYLFPLIVTNKPVYKEKTTSLITPLITYLELKATDFTKDLQIDTLKKPSGFVEIRILGRKTRIPWLSVSP